jgi:hypothetical protein
MNPLHYAVVVGINEYPAIGNLTAAHADAQDFFVWVSSQAGGGVPPANAHRILAVLPPNVTVEEAQPTTDAIYRAFDQCITSVKAVPANSWEETRLYFYCAGHGIAPGPRDAALLAANVTRESLGNHISCELLMRFFSRVQLFHELAVFSDCCRTRTGKNVDPRPPYWTYDDKINGPVQKYWACAAIYGQQAFEEFDRPADERRGYFTRALMEGLRGAPAAIEPGSGCVTDRLLGPFIAEHMRQATKDKFNSPLEAEFIQEGPGSMSFGPALPRAPSVPPQSHAGKAP